MRNFMWVTLVSTILLSAFTDSPFYKAQESQDMVPPDTVSIITDPLYHRGLNLKRANAPSPGTLYPFGASNSPNPKWELAEWGSKFELSEEDKVFTDGEIAYANPEKNISFKRMDSTVAVSMDVFTSKEYDSPRVQNQAWPHLLIEQAFDENVRIKRFGWAYPSLYRTIDKSGDENE